MTAARGAWLLAALVLLGACSGRRARRARPAPAAVAAQAHLGEWFTSGSGRCQVSGAEPLLTESALLPFPGARVKPDVAALDLSLTCENRLGAAARSREVLPLDALVLLRDPAGRKYAARSESGPREPDDGVRATREKPAEQGPDHFVFELPESDARSVAAPRRFDADSGEPSVARESAVGTLEIRAPSLAVDVLLRPRFYGASFDAFLDRFARALAHGTAADELATDGPGADELSALSALYAEIQKQFAATRFELVAAAPTAPAATPEPTPAAAPAAPDSAEALAAPNPGGTPAKSSRADAGATVPDELLAVFALSRPRRAANDGEIARFETRLARDKRGTWHLAGFENRAAARQVLDCRELDASFEARLARAHGERARGDGSAESCNVLGLLIPGSCAHADPELIERALAVRTRCHVPRAAEERRTLALPEDFQLTLRRGRPERGLDHQPRYLLTLFATGQVVFHGRHWVSTRERSDGRTARALVADLYARLSQLDWFTRRASSAARACTQNEQGDLISARAHGRERTVVDRAGCRDPFSEAELGELKRRLELIAGVSGFIAPRPEYADDKVEHWTLAESAAE
jgi:hypothetical protein